MFAKHAQRNFARSFGLGRNPAAVRPCNDNQPIHGTAPARPMRRPALFCRWRRTAAGRLECHWAHGRPDLSDEGISCPAGQARHHGGIAILAA